MLKPGLILIGAGGHACSCIDVIEQQAKYSIAGLVGFAEQRHSKLLGYEIFATDSDLDDLRRTFSIAVITIGQIKTADSRKRLYQRAESLGFVLPTIVSPTAYVSRHANIGAGTIVMHGAIVNAGAQVGRNCIINTNSLIEHDATIGDHCHISTGAILNGGVHVGSGSFIGSGSVIKEGVAVGKECIVGLGVKLHQSLMNDEQRTNRSQS